MRTLPSTLLVAQKNAARRPYLKVEVVEKVGGVARLAWERLYSGSEDDFYHAATMPGDGSLLRARVNQSTYQLYYQRVTNPGPGSNFGAWAAMGTVSSTSSIALASRGATVLLFYVDTDQRTIVLRESNDYGATFSAPLLLYTATPSTGKLAVDLNAQGVVALFFSVGSTIYVMKRTGGTWSSPPTPWTNSLSSVTGLACCYYGDWNVMVSGQDAPGNYKVATCVYGDGYSRNPGVWSPLVDLALASSGSGVEYHYPFLALPDVFRAFFVERYTGTVYYSRPMWAYAMATADYISSLWREPVPFNLTSNYGLALASSATQAWLSSPCGVWRASLSPAPLDVSADLLALSLREEPGSGQLVFELRNDDGRYNTLGSGPNAAIKEGSEVRVSPGYHTSAGPQTSSGPAYWIEGWEYLSSPGRSSLLLQARDGWGLLEGWRARRQYAWPSGSKNIFQLLSFILARAGLEYSTLSASSALSDEYPSFTIHPGESGAAAVKRLLDKVPDVLFFRGYFAYSKNPQPGDASDYGYGTDHPLLAGRYVSRTPGANRVQVYGSGLVSETFSWPDLEKVYDRLHQVHDLNLNSQARAQARGQAELRGIQRAATSGEVVVPVNCGQELYDVIALTDSRVGLVAAQCRILGLALTYGTGERARYEQRLLLGGV